VKRLALFLCIIIFPTGCNNGGGESKWPTNPIETAVIVNPQNIWIATDNGELIYLKDAATTTMQLEHDVAAVDFINKDVGWSPMKNGDVFQTHNGGANWHKIGEVRRNIKGNWPFWTPGRMMQFSDANVGWIAVSRSVFRTEDGGQTWKSFDVPQQDSPTGMVVASRNEFWCITATGIVFHTSDGGATWQANELPGRRPNYWYSQAIALDREGRVWAGVQSPKPVLFVSSDQGKTWDDRIFPAGAGTISVKSIQFAPDGTGRTVFRRIVDTDQPESSSVVVTTDFGETWKPVASVSLPFEPLRVEFRSASLGFLIGKTDIAMTEDGGANWSIVYRSRERPTQ
jgi:photosystem II stability/assembly factor-like uncharacterized protein